MKNILFLFGGNKTKYLSLQHKTKQKHIIQTITDMNKNELLAKMVKDNLQDLENGNEIARKNLLILAKELEKIANGK